VALCLHTLNVLPTWRVTLATLIIWFDSNAGELALATWNMAATHSVSCIFEKSLLFRFLRHSPIFLILNMQYGTPHDLNITLNSHFLILLLFITSFCFSWYFSSWDNGEPCSSTSLVICDVPSMVFFRKESIECSPGNVSRLLLVF
jgi:hypothetical protein